MRFAWLLLLAGCPDAGPPHVPDGTACPGFGLYFFGPGLADADRVSPLLPVAVGGTESVEVEGLRDGDHAELSGGAIDHADDNPSTQVFGVRGVAAGTGDLCIVGSDGHLHDGTPIVVADIANARLVPAELDEAELDPLARWSVFAGARRTIGVALDGDDGARLVDTSMTIAIAGATPLGRDAVAVDLPAGRARVTATPGDGHAWTLPLDVVDHVDTIELATPNVPIRATASWSELCFRATTGGTRVIQAPWSFEASGTVALGVDGLGAQANCTLVRPLEVGAAHVIAHAGGASLDVSVEVTP